MFPIIARVLKECFPNEDGGEVGGSMSGHRSFGEFAFKSFKCCEFVLFGACNDVLSTLDAPKMN